MNDFEKACNDVERDVMDSWSGEMTVENVIEWLQNKNVACCTFSQGRYISRLKKLKEKYPDDVKIIAENKDGSVVARFPVKWVKIGPPRKQELTEDRKEKLLAGAKAYREGKNS